MLTGYWAEFLGLAVIHFLAVIVPGPDFAVTVRQSVRFGHWVGINTALGIGAGISVHVAYTLVGVSALMHATPWLMTLAQIAGGAYLLYLGINFIRSKPMTPGELADEFTSPEPQSLTKSFVVGFMTNATNPKATLFFLAVFTTVVRATTPLTIQALYGLWMCLVNAAWFVLVCLIFSNPAIRQRFVKSGYWFERFMGVVMIGFSVRLLFITL
ncbi:LysE family translocator [Halomonas elongata]|uniref:LysE family translocator n=1 Tax=Halomonas elongata TaxID=2746 RepID=UPI0033610FD6